MARRPQPLSLRVLNGRSEGRDSGGRPLETPLTTDRRAPRMPSWLPDGAKRCWRRVVPALDAMHVLKPADCDALVAYCIAVNLMEESAKIIAAEGMTVKANGSIKPHPAVSTLNSSMKQVKAFAVEFGLTPASESSITGIQPTQPDQYNPFNTLIINK